MLVQVYSKSLICSILILKLNFACFVLRLHQFVGILGENSKPGSVHEVSYPKLIQFMSV